MMITNNDESDHKDSVIEGLNHLYDQAITIHKCLSSGPLFSLLIPPHICVTNPFSLLLPYFFLLPSFFSLPLPCLLTESLMDRVSNPSIYSNKSYGCEGNLYYQVKQPGLDMATTQSELDLSYQQRYAGLPIPEAYERLILDT